MVRKFLWLSLQSELIFLVFSAIMKTVLLVDGSNFLYRAFHGLPDLRTSAGEPTGAIKGFANMLKMIRSMIKPFS